MIRIRHLALVVMAACDDTLFEPSAAVADAPPDTYVPDWAGVQALIDDQCVVCHGAGLANPVVLPDDIEADVTEGTGFYVVAGSPADSKLWRVLSGELQDDDLNAMPLGSPLPLTYTLHVKGWIALGAVIE